MGERESGALNSTYSSSAHEMGPNSMMFWTLIPGFQLKVSDWTDQRALHGVVMSLFPTTLPGGELDRRAASKILFRVDDTVAGRVVLVQSLIAPSRSPVGVQIKTVNCRTGPAIGTSVRFRIAVNAVERRRRSDGKHRDAPLAGDQVDRWLIGKFEGALTDMTILNVVRSVYGTDRNGSKPGVPAVLQVDAIDGVGTVQDSDRLLRLIVDGVGRAKAYGCGLLTISPINTQL